MTPAGPPLYISSAGLKALEGTRNVYFVKPCKKTLQKVSNNSEEDEGTTEIHTSGSLPT